MHERTETGILLHPKVDNPNIWYVWLLKNREVVQRQQWIKTAVPNNIYDEIYSIVGDDAVNISNNDDDEFTNMDDIGSNQYWEETDENIYDDPTMRRILWSDDDNKDNVSDVQEMDLIITGNENVRKENERKVTGVTNERYNLRKQRSSWKERVFNSYHVYAEDLCDNEMEIANAAIKEELQQMLDKEVFEPVSEVTKRPITSFVFLKKKLDSEGKLTRIKARLVANGSKQLYDGIAYSPTAMNTSIMLTLKIGGIKGMVIGTIDVKGAYLNAQMDDMVLMKLSGKVLDVLLDMKPEWQGFASNKSMVVKLK